MSAPSQAGIELCALLLCCAGHGILPTFSDAGDTSSSAGNESLLLTWAKGPAPPDLAGSDTSACPPHLVAWDGHGPSEVDKSHCCKGIYPDVRDAARVLADGV